MWSCITSEGLDRLQSSVRPTSVICSSNDAAPRKEFRFKCKLLNLPSGELFIKNPKGSFPAKMLRYITFNDTTDSYKQELDRRSSASWVWKKVKMTKLRPRRTVYTKKSLKRNFSAKNQNVWITVKRMKIDEKHQHTIDRKSRSWNRTET